MIRIGSSPKVATWETNSDIKPVINNEVGKVVQQASKVEGTPISEDATQNYLEKAVDDLNKTMDVIDRRLEFSIHEETNRVMVRVLDRSEAVLEEEKVIREIPPEKLLDLVAEIKKLIGILIDCRV